MKTAATFFSGIGGACHGLQLAGYDVIFGTDNWDFVQPIWQDLHPDAEFLLADFLTLDFDQVPKADLYWFSPPCQNFSTANPNRHSLEGDTLALQLVHNISDLIRDKLPSRVIIENVPRYVNSECYDVLLTRIEGLGYTSQTQVVNCAYYGVPQSRKRLIMVLLVSITLLPLLHHSERFDLVIERVLCLSPVL